MRLTDSSCFLYKIVTELSSLWKFRFILIYKFKILCSKIICFGIRGFDFKLVKLSIVIVTRCTWSRIDPKAFFEKYVCLFLKINGYWNENVLSIIFTVTDVLVTPRGFEETTTDHYNKIWETIYKRAACILPAPTHQQYWESCIFYALFFLVSTDVYKLFNNVVFHDQLYFSNNF